MNFSVVKPDELCGNIVVGRLLEGSILSSLTLYTLWRHISRFYFFIVLYSLEVLKSTSTPSMEESNTIPYGPCCDHMLIK